MHQGETMKLESIWHEYHNSLHAFLLKNLKNRADVDDVLQEVLLKTHQNLHTLHDASKLKSWLFQITHNAMLDFYRKQRPTEELDEKSVLSPNNEVSIIEQMGPCVETFIKALPSDQAKLLTAIELEGQEQKQYAQAMGINYSTLKSRVQKSRTQLYDLFNQCCSFSFDKRGNIMEVERKK